MALPTTESKSGSKDAFPNIRGYRIEGIIDRGGMSTVYRATRGGQSFAIKYFERFKADSLGFSKNQFRREAALLARINHAGLVKVVEINEAEDRRPFLVLELVEGQSLAKLLARGPLRADRLRSVAEGVTRALCEIQRYGLVHRDLKPANILIASDGSPKIVDFGLAVATSARGAVDTEQNVAGTLLYSAPEQIGLINRGVDGRADLYSLGCVLFECATGRVPVEGADLNELLRQHATAEVPQLRSLAPEFPRAFAEVIHKLLAKDPDDRYANAQQLLSDLVALEDLEKNGVPLGVQGVSKRSYQFPIVGRDAELDALLGAWKQTLNGDGQIVILSGGAGTGKSRLIGEFLERVGDDVAVLAGKCPMGAPIPLGVIRDMLDQFLRQSDGLPQNERRQLQERLLGALGEFGPLLKGLSTEMSKRLPQVKESLTVQAEEVYFEAIATFLQRLSQAFPALVMFVDDIQWIDDTSRKVLARLSLRLKGCKLLMLCACRSEPEYQDALARFAPDAADRKAEIALKPLSSGAVHDLIQTHLGARDLPGGEFVLRLTSLSQGNPLAIEEYLRAMLEAGCLYPSWGAWSVELAELEKLQLSADVMQLIVNRVAVLDADTRDVLAAAAVLGSPFDHAVLRNMLGHDVGAALFRGVDAHLIEQQRFGRDGRDLYNFVHDRVQETLLSNLPAERRRDLHQRSAEALRALPEAQRQEKENIFAQAQHAMQGHVERAPEATYDANVTAGRTALESHSYWQALEFFGNAYEVGSRFKLERDLTSLLEDRADAALSSNDYPSAIAFAEQALEKATKPMQRARIVAITMEAYWGMTDFRRMQRTLRKALLELNAPLRSWLGGFASTVWHALAAWFLGRTGWRFGQAGPKAERYRLLARIYMQGIVGQVVDINVGTLFQLVARLRYTAHFLGVSHELARSYSLMALLCASIRFKPGMRKYMRLALATAQRLSDPTLVLRVKSEVVVALMVVSDAALAVKLATEAYQTEREWVTHVTLAQLAGPAITMLSLRGYARESLPWLDELVPTKNELSLLELPMALYIAPRMGQKAILGDLQGALADRQRLEMLGVTEKLRTYMARLVSCYCFLTFYTETGDVQSEACEEWADNSKFSHRNPVKASFSGWLYLTSLLHARLLACWDEKLGGGVSPRRLEQLKQVMRQLKQVRSSITRQHHQMGLGALAWFLGKPRKALALLNQAEESARRGDNPWAWFEALKFRAAVLRELGDEESSQKDGMLALWLARHHGWAPRAQRLRKAFPQLQDSTTRSESDVRTSPSSPMSRTSPLSGEVANLRLKRHLDALLQLNRVSSKVGRVEEQTRAALDEVIRILNAERGFLFFVGETGLTIAMARDAHQQDISKDSVYSRSIVDKVRSTQMPVLTGDQGEGLSTSQSIVAHQLRSVMAAPLMNERDLVGVLYVDSTVARGLFQEPDLELLEAVCGHLAVNVEAARARQLEIDNQLLTKEQELTAMRLKSAHAAGMAEIATGSIHNIGNTLTSVVVHFELLRNKLAGAAVNDNLRADVAARLDKIDQGLKNVENVVLMQQEYAKAGLHQEELHLEALVEEALGLLSGTLQNISIRKNYAVLPAAKVQRNKYLNVVINLLKNAAEAMSETPADQKVLEISTYAENGRVCLKVADRGVGISSEILQAIFAHGFTTKANGHGFGLHICANAMREMGGTIRAESSGVGQGAEFVVCVPSVGEISANQRPS